MNLTELFNLGNTQQVNELHWVNDLCLDWVNDLTEVIELGFIILKSHTEIKQLVLERKMSFIRKFITKIKRLHNRRNHGNIWKALSTRASRRCISSGGSRWGARRGRCRRRCWAWRGDTWEGEFLLSRMLGWNTGLFQSSHPRLGPGLVSDLDDL